MLVGLQIRTYDATVILGGKYDNTKITATAFYGNETTEIITYDKLTVSELITTAAGNVVLTVSYTEDGVTKEAQATVKVLGITGMAVEGIASTVNFGGTLDTTGALATVTFGEGNEAKTLVVGLGDGLTVSALNTQQAGDQTLTVSYLGFNKSITVHVLAIQEIRVLAGTLPKNVRYGYSIDSSDLRLEITYTNGTKVIKSKSELGAAISVTYGETRTTAANVAVTVSYTENTVTKTTVETVEVLKIKSISALNGTVPTTVLRGAAYPLDNVRLTVIYTDNVEGSGVEFYYLVDVNDPFLNITNIDTTNAGEKALIFGFMPTDGGFEYTTAVTVMVKGPSKIELIDSTMQLTVNKDQKLDVSGAQFKVTFTDGTYAYIDTTNIDLKLSTIDTSTTGTKKLTVTYLDCSVDITIEVVDVTGEIGDIFGIELPDSIVARNSYKNNFMAKNEPYVVGDDNPYLFYLNVLILDKNDDLLDVDGRSVETIAKIYLVGKDGETLLEGDALTAMVAVDSKKNTYDFTEDAVGKTFRIEIKPKENYYGTATKSHTVTVVDAYNIYDAKELNLISNFDYDINSNEVEGYLSSQKVINEFLNTNDIVRPEGDINGIVLHSNITIEMTDIPSEFYYTYTKNGQEKTEFYDFTYVYYRAVSVDAPVFSMYGNYYTLYSYGLPCIVENGIVNNDDAFSSAALFRFRYDSFDPEHPLTVDYTNDNYHVYVKNMAFRDNDPNSNDQAASERHMRGLYGLQATMINFHMYNSNMEAFYISLDINGDYTYMNLDSCKLYNAWQGHIFVWNKNHVAEDTSTTDQKPHANYQTNKINITNSSLTKCGGPVILAQTDMLDTGKECYKYASIDVVVDEASVLESYVTGQEAWFVAVNQTPLAMQIMAMNQLIQGTAGAFGMNASYTTNNVIDGVNTINLVFVNMSTVLPGEGPVYKVNGSFKRVTSTGEIIGLDMSNNAAVDGYNQAFDTLVQMGKIDAAPPVFQSSNGGTCFGMPYGDAPGCYSINPTTFEQGYPDPSCFMGDYIGLYYMGLGVVLEYFH